MIADGQIVGDGTWELKVLVTDLAVERCLRVKGDLHIGGVMLRLVEELGNFFILHFIVCVCDVIKRREGKRTPDLGIELKNASILLFACRLRPFSFSLKFKNRERDAKLLVSLVPKRRGKVVKTTHTTVPDDFQMKPLLFFKITKFLITQW